MFDWAKNAVGLTDKHHGSAACHSVKQQTKGTPYTELTRQYLRWEVIGNTCVESRTFYMTTDAGRLAFVQITYSNVLNVKTTAQLGVKLFSEDASRPHLWHLDTVPKFKFANDKYDFVGEKCSVILSADGKSYSVQSTLNSACTFDLTFTQLAPGFMAGKDGTTIFGADPQKPTGTIKHLFWPRMRVEGAFHTKEGRHDMKGIGSFVHAVQGVKPHFAAARWDFAHFHSPRYSALSMQYVTPGSYDHTVVSVGGIATEGKLIVANADSTATHVSSIRDPESKHAEPKAITYTWSGSSSDGEKVAAQIEAVFPEQRLDKVDIMAEIPKVFKNLVAGVTGVSPYMYQNAIKAKLRLTVDGENKEDVGVLCSEATFLS